MEKEQRINEVNAGNRTDKSQHIFTYESGLVEINGVSIGLPSEEFQRALIEQGFTIVEETEDSVIIKGNIEGLGSCFLKIFKANDTIRLVIVLTEHKYNEEEMLTVFEQVKEDLPGDVLYDDGGYGVLPKPHEVRHFWDFNQGYVTINWQGYKDTETNESSLHERECSDNITFWIRKPIIKDEEYWRSEVD